MSTISRHFGSLQLYQLLMKVAKGCMPKCMEIALDCLHVIYILYIGYHIDIVIIMLIIHIDHVIYCMCFIEGKYHKYVRLTGICASHEVKYVKVTVY